LSLLSAYLIDIPDDDEDVIGISQNILPITIATTATSCSSETSNQHYVIKELS
jgi:hypothetical protein